MNWSFVVTFLSGGLAGAFVKHLIDMYRNRIQKLECQFIEDDVISRLPVTFDTGQHQNLHSKKFIIKNTTNRDIESIKVVFEFEPQSIITKWRSYSKAGQDIPKGRITSEKNECYFVLKYINRGEEVEVYFEIANINQDVINVTEMDCTGIKVKLTDRRRSRPIQTLKVVEKRSLNAA